LVDCGGGAIFFSWTTFSGQKVARALNALPGVEAEAQQNLPLKEVSAGNPYRVSGAAPFADNRIDGSRHCSVGCFPSDLLHKQYALKDGGLAIFILEGCRPERDPFCCGAVCAETAGKDAKGCKRTLTRRLQPNVMADLDGSGFG
jgi:hypothetical protein